MKKEQSIPPEKKTLVRGEPIVREVLDATLHELANVGYGALRIEDVATRAGVNKTTVYRRYPTKQELVRAALMALTTERFQIPDTGSLRGDLLAAAELMTYYMNSVEGSCMSRVLVTDSMDPELADVAEAIREANDAKPTVIFARAVARGEIASSKYGVMVVRTLVGALHSRIRIHREAVSKADLEALVDMLLGGVVALSARPSVDA